MKFRKVSIIIATIAGILGCQGSFPSPPDTPSPPAANLYQPLSFCPGEIEYKWQDLSGERRSFFPGSGDVCIFLPEKITGSSVDARCVERDDAGNIVQSGEWIQARVAGMLEFMELCPDL